MLLVMTSPVTSHSWGQQGGDHSFKMSQPTWLFNDRKPTRKLDECLTTKRQVEVAMPQFTFEEGRTGWQTNIKSGDPWKTSAVGRKNDTHYRTYKI